MDYITLMPLDVQNLIRNETRFTRLNKTIVSGVNHLPHLARRKITKQEIIHYINSLPKYVVLFTHTYVIELKFINNMYNIFGCLINNTSLNVNHIQTSIDLNQIHLFINQLDDVDYCDIFTTHAIYLLRKELLYNNIDIKKIIMEEYNNHINYDDNFINKMNTCIYIVSNIEQHNKFNIRTFLVPLKVDLSNFIIDDIHERLDFKYNKYKPIADNNIINYIINT